RRVVLAPAPTHDRWVSDTNIRRKCLQSTAGCCSRPRGGKTTHSSSKSVVFPPPTRVSRPRSGGGIDPIETTGERLLPLPVTLVALTFVPERLPATKFAPILAQFLGAAPVTNRQTGSIGSTQNRSFGDLGADNGHPEHIGLDLH